MRLQVTLLEGSQRPVRVGDEKELAVGESYVIDTTEGTVGITELSALTESQMGGDVFDPSNRPNGIVMAAVGPKLPKAGGELAQVEEGGRVVERAVDTDVGRATQGGGVESTDGKTPGPVPAQDAERGAGNAAATGPAGDGDKPAEVNKAPSAVHAKKK